MREVVLLLYLCLGVLPMFAQPFRIATWQVQSWPPVKGVTQVSAADEDWFARVATPLSEADADVILLYGVPDSESARKLAGLLKPQKYAVAHHFGLQASGPKGPFIGAPFALFTRKERLAGKTVPWGETGRIELPGGFSFVTFRHGPSLVAVYVAAMPGSLTNAPNGPDTSYYLRKRLYAAQYLVHHASWLATTYTNPIFATYLTGDLSVNPKGGADEPARILERAGFRAMAPGAAEDKSAYSVTNTLTLDRVLDPVFTRNIDFVASRQVPRNPPEYALLTCDLTLKPPNSAAASTKAGKPAVKPAPAPPAAPEPVALPAPATPRENSSATIAATRPPGTASTQAPAGEIAPVPAPPGRRATPAVATASAPLNAKGGRSWLWPTAAGGVLLLALFGLWKRMRPARSPATARQLTARLNDAVFLELTGGPAARREPVAPPGEAILRASPTSTGNAQNVPWRGTVAANPGGSDAATERLRITLMPHLKRLMREKLVVWLSAQRAQLIDSQEQGSAQVLELQARLEQLKNQFQERLLSQQQRILELDHALKTKEKLLRELLRKS